MLKKIQNHFLILNLCIIFLLIIFAMAKLKLRLDFFSFYAASRAYQYYSNPFYNLYAFFLSKPYELSINLGTPFFLWLISPLTHLSIQYALLIFSTLSFLCSLVAIHVTMLIFFTEAERKKVRWAYYVICLGVYPTIINFSIGQLGSFLFFFIVCGYYFYLKKQDCLSGFFWGIIIAIKLFPALLLFFACSEQRYAVIKWTLFFSLIAIGIPVISHGLQIYELYSSLLPRLLWYGHIWNASLYGFIFRFISVPPYERNLLLIKGVYLVLFAISLLLYTKKIGTEGMSSHQRFSISLVLMLFLSPLGWHYYFSILIIPFTYLWVHHIETPRPQPIVTLLWFFSFFLLNIPFHTNLSIEILWHASPWGLNSVYFYGLNILLFTITRLPSSCIMYEIMPTQMPNYRHLFSIILFFGWFLPIHELYNLI